MTHFVAGGSTGGTISGTGRFLKDMNPNIKVVLPDPVGSVFWDFWANRKSEKELEAKSYQVTAPACTLYTVCDCSLAQSYQVTLPSCTFLHTLCDFLLAENCFCLPTLKLSRHVRF